MKPLLLSVSKLNFSLGKKPLLSNINLDIKVGELVGIIGPNGAGKSTLLKNIVGIHKPDQGHIAINGVSLHQLSHLQRAEKISYLAQRQEAAFPFTVADTIKLGAHALQMRRRTSQSTLNQQVSRIAEQLNISALLPRQLDQLSGGETQLVHFARILMQNTCLMLLDEPTAALDIGHEAQLMNLLRQQCRSGSTALVAIHNLNIAAAYCDRLILLDKGKLIASGRAEEVITQAQLTQLYDHQVMVSQNPISGTVTVLPMPERQSTVSFKVHLIGGAGSTVALVRALLQMGIEVTAGIGHEQDSDTDYWLTTGVEHVKVPAFSAIDPAAFERAKQLVANADLTILTEFPIGSMNIDNLHLAAEAKNLWILEENPDQLARFYHPDMIPIYQVLRQHSQVFTALAAIEQLKNTVGKIKASLSLS